MAQKTVEAYANEIRAIRERLGLTQAEMAERLGLRSDSLSRYERGTRHVPEPTMRLARQLGQHQKGGKR